MARFKAVPVPLILCILESKGYVIQSLPHYVHTIQKIGSIRLFFSARILFRGSIQALFYAVCVHVRNRAQLGPFRFHATCHGVCFDNSW